MKYVEILQENAALGRTIKSEYSIAILSNVVVHQAKEIIEHCFRKDGICAVVEVCEYDNIIQEASRVAEFDCIVVMWEFANIGDDFAYRMSTKPSSEIREAIENLKSQIDLLLQTLSKSKMVIMNKFSSAPLASGFRGSELRQKFCNELNLYLEERRKNNLHLINLDDVYMDLSVSRSVDFRNFFGSKSLYTIEFFDFYSRWIKPIIKYSLGSMKKALVLDCDETLWKGVLAEDGFFGIKIYREIQHLIVSLAEAGVIICLCSKNNFEDVQEVLDNHPDMVLRDEHIVIKEVNWDNKAVNLSRIAENLNIGLDSLVFLDDSSFEVNLIREKLPSVEVFQVPASLSKYYQMMAEICDFVFFNSQSTMEDKNKIAQYKMEAERSRIAENFHNIDDFISSLGLVVDISVDPISQVLRLAQLSQKTNQFNLTTKRYQVRDIENFIDSPNYLVASIDVSDKFGAYGITGLAIIEKKNDDAEIDTFLMSCRILGRGIELSFLDALIQILSSKGCKRLIGNYCETPKNGQVADFYSKAGFIKTLSREGGSTFVLDCREYASQKIDLIEVKYA